MKINYKIHYFLLFHFLKLRKKMALKNLRTAFPGKDERWYNTTIKALYRFTVEEIVDFLNDVESKGGEIFSVDSTIDTGLRVSGLGGIISLLRFPLEF